MFEELLHRKDAPFSDKVWEKIDQAVVTTAKGVLNARRLLKIEGPYGLGLKTLAARDETSESGGGLAPRPAVPLATIEDGFKLAARDIAAFEQTGVPFDTLPASAAAVACARREDDLIFNGSKALGVDGLLTAKGTQSLKLKPWDQVGAAVEDLTAAVSKLDAAGYSGPYTLALAPPLYNRLFRRYPDSALTELEHARMLVTDGIIKAGAIQTGGVLMASGAWVGTIVLGQDLAVGFVGPSGRSYDFSVSETVALRLSLPDAVCVLQQPQSR